MNVQETPLDLQEFEDRVNINGKIILVSEHVEYIFIFWVEITTKLEILREISESPPTAKAEELIRAKGLS